MVINTIKKMAKGVYIGIGKLISTLFSTRLNKVVICCYYRIGYSCNPKYIAEALERLYPGEFKIVLLVNKPDKSVPTFVKQVKYRRLKMLYELATARFWIDNCRSQKFVPKKDDQVYIQTWHAYIQIKKVEKDAEPTINEQYLLNTKNDGFNTDLMFANNDYQEKIYQNSFWYDGPIIRCGVPRNRPLIHQDNALREKVYSRLGIDPEHKICLYAPTFRKDLSLEAYEFNYEKCCQVLSERFGGKYVFVFRLHQSLVSKSRPDFFRGFVDATSYPDAQEIIASCDVLISDYSSIMEDFILTGKPGFMYAPDIATYNDDRSFYYSLDNRPFSIAENEEELFSSIRLFTNEGYKKTRDLFLLLSIWSMMVMGMKRSHQLLSSSHIQGARF